MVGRVIGSGRKTRNDLARRVAHAGLGVGEGVQGILSRMAVRAVDEADQVEGLTIVLPAERWRRRRRRCS